mgnify:CR=1 FL=1
MQISAIYNHSASVGSTPVGLWAQTCNNTIDPILAYDKHSIVPAQLKPLVFGSKYGYSN